MHMERFTDKNKCSNFPELKPLKQKICLSISRNTTIDSGPQSAKGEITYAAGILQASLSVIKC